MTPAIDHADDQHDDDWSPCPPGTLRALAEGLSDEKRRRARRRQIVAAAVSVCVLLTAITVYGTWLPPRESGGGGLTCGEVMDALPDYVAGTLESPIRDGVDRHLEKCPECRQAYQELASTAAGPRARGPALAWRE